MTRMEAAFSFYHISFIILFVIAGIIVLIASGSTNSSAESATLVSTGLELLFLGPVLSWLGSLGLYAIGESAENSAIAKPVYCAYGIDC